MAESTMAAANDATGMAAQGWSAAPTVIPGELRGEVPALGAESRALPQSAQQVSNPGTEVEEHDAKIDNTFSTYIFVAWIALTV